MPVWVWCVYIYRSGHHCRSGNARTSWSSLQKYEQVVLLVGLFSCIFSETTQRVTHSIPGTFANLIHVRHIWLWHHPCGNWLNWRSCFCTLVSISNATEPIHQGYKAGTWLWRPWCLPCVVWPATTPTRIVLEFKSFHQIPSCYTKNISKQFMGVMKFQPRFHENKHKKFDTSHKRKTKVVFSVQT